MVRKPKKRAGEALILFRKEFNFKPKVVKSKKIYTRKGRKSREG